MKVHSPSMHLTRLRTYAPVFVELPCQVRPGIPKSPSGRTKCGVVSPRPVQYCSSRRSISRVLMPEYSAALSPWRTGRAVHNPSKVLLEVALPVALGGPSIRCRRAAGRVGHARAGGASDPTLFRLITTLTLSGRRALTVICGTHAQARSRVWRLVGCRRSGHRGHRRGPGAAILAGMTHPQGASAEFTASNNLTPARDRAGINSPSLPLSEKRLMLLAYTFEALSSNVVVVPPVSATADPPPRMDSPSDPATKLIGLPYVYFNRPFHTQPNEQTQPRTTHSVSEPGIENLAIRVWRPQSVSGGCGPWIG
jgi:hypothetical protein